jgi:hypothetical protein
MRHPVGCRACGAKSSSRFRPWPSCAHIKGFEGVEFAVPHSDVVCDVCHQRAKRGTLKVCPHVSQVAHASPFVHFFYVHSSMDSRCAQLLFLFLSPMNQFHHRVSDVAQKADAASSAAPAGDDALTEDESDAQEEAEPPDGGGGRVIAHRCDEGCVLCGRKRGRRFHIWRASKYATEIENLVDPKSPTSAFICDPCLAGVRNSSHSKSQAVRPPPSSPLLCLSIAC